MKHEHLDNLRKAREALLAARRNCIARMINSNSSAPSQYVPELLSVQSGIEAIDRASEEERRLAK